MSTIAQSSFYAENPKGLALLEEKLLFFFPHIWVSGLSWMICQMGCPGGNPELLVSIFEILIQVSHRTPSPAVHVFLGL